MGDKMNLILSNELLSSKILLIILIALIFLIKNRRRNVCRILMIATSLFLVPFLFYIYPSVLLSTLSYSVLTMGGGMFFQTWFVFFITLSITIMIMAVLIKINVKPFSKKALIMGEGNEYVKLERGKSLLQYSIWYTLYITIIHIPICLFIIIICSFSPMAMIYAPYVIFSLISMYGPAVIMSINGSIRVKGKPILRLLILMLIPFVNFIMMIKLNYDVKKTLKEWDTNFG